MERLTRRDLADVNGKQIVLCDSKEEDCNDSCLYRRCKWNEKALRKLKEYEDAEEQGVPPVETPTWIPCSERLPEPEKEVLLQFENNMVVGFFFVEGGHFDGTTNWYGLADDDCYTDCDAKPIAWQPLPEPYKGE